MPELDAERRVPSRGGRMSADHCDACPFAGCSGCEFQGGEAMTEFVPKWVQHSVAVRVSREMALDFGMVTPTPEEAAERAESLRKWREREAAAWVVYDAMVPRLDALTDPTARAVLDLHRNEDADRPACSECYIGDDRETWPCATVKAVAEVHGIAVPDIELWNRPKGGA